MQKRSAGLMSRHPLDSRPQSSFRSGHQGENAGGRGVIDWLRRIQSWRGYISAADFASVVDLAADSSSNASNEPQADDDCVLARVCVGLPCALAGADQRCRFIAERAALVGQDIVRETCLSRCWEAPAAVLDGPPPRENPDPDLSAQKGDERLQSYLSSGGYSVFKSCLSKRRTPESILYSLSANSIASLEKASSPLGVRLRELRTVNAASKLCLVIDESRPAEMSQTYFIENFTHHVIEGLLICAYAAGAKEIVIGYDRRHRLLRRLLESEIARAKASGVECSLRIAFVDASAETEQNLLRKLCFAEGGDKASSVLIVSPEILRWVPEILAMGTDAFEGASGERIAAPVLFSISGCVATPGVYKARVGSTVQELIDVAGGIKDGQHFHSFVAGEWSNPAIPARYANLSIDGASLMQTPLLSFPIAVISHGDPLQRPCAFGAEHFPGQIPGKDEA
jgi:formate dehydrogenase